jgi:hypothetical protein
VLGLTPLALSSELGLSPHRPTRDGARGKELLGERIRLRGQPLRDEPPYAEFSPATTMSRPEQKNYDEIERLETLLAELRQEGGTARETAAIREIGLEIALAIREVGAMLVNVGWEQSYASAPQREPESPPERKEGPP